MGREMWYGVVTGGNADTELEQDSFFEEEKEIMKKRWIAVLALSGLLALTAACGTNTDTAKNENTAEDTAEGGIAAEYPGSSITRLGKYDGVEIAAVSTEVTDEEIQAQIDNLLASYPASVPIEDKTVVESGDIVNIDFVGRLDGEEFEGGSSGGEGFDLEIGSGSFIDGFEDGLIGKEVGTTVDLPLTFPDPYTPNPDLAGQDVVFEVTIHAIVEHVTPEWNDEFASEHTGYDTAAAYEESLRESLQQQKEESAVSQRQYEAMQAVIADSEFECSEEELQSLRDSRTQEYETYASYYGLELDDFLLQAMQMTREDFDSEVETWADFQLKCTLAIDAIAKAENITVSEEEYETGLQQLADDYGAESPEAFEEEYGRSTVENSLLYDKTVEFVTDRAVEM